jgi:hypothetical protein
MSPGEVESTATGTCPTPEVEGVLQGKMSWWYLFAMAVASILGPWVVMSQFWYSVSGPSIALAFVVVGLICIPIGLVYGELSAMFENGRIVLVHQTRVGEGSIILDCVGPFALIFGIDVIHDELASHHHSAGMGA